MNIKAAIFDMDGTLIDSLMFWDILWKYCGERFLGDPGFRPGDQVERGVRTVTLREAMELVHSACGIAGSGEELFAVADAKIEDFYRNEVEIKPGVLEFLQCCQENNVKMCVASATEPRLVEIAMKHCGIDKYLTKIISCTEIGKGKEFPDVYLKALEYLGTPKEETWVFEDSYSALHTAHEAGFPTVGIYDPHNFSQNVVKANSTIYVGEGETLGKLL